MRGTRIVLMVVLCVALTLIGLPASIAGAAAPGCGATITKSTTLTADVGPCTGNGLIITSSNIVLNLRGHRIFGANVQSTNNFVGVLLKNVSRVTVLGPGSVSRFSAGVAIDGGRANTVRRVFAHDNNSTQWINDNPDLAVYGDGIAVNSSSYNVITNNRVSGNGPFSGISIFTSMVGGGNPPPQVSNIISNNVVVNNDVPDACPSSGEFYDGPCTPGEAVFNENIGIRVEGPLAVSNIVSGNSVSGSGREGISVLNIGGLPQNRNRDTRIIGNDSSGNGTARVITDSKYGQLGGDGFFNRCFGPTSAYGPSYQPNCPTGTILKGNTFNNNPAHGLNLDFSQFSTVIGNKAFGNGFGNQTSEFSDPPYTDAMDMNSPPCNTNTWRNNQFGTVNDPCVDPKAQIVPVAASAALARQFATLVHPSPRPGGRALIQ